METQRLSLRLEDCQLRSEDHLYQYWLQLNRLHESIRISSLPQYSEAQIEYGLKDANPSLSKSYIFLDPAQISHARPWLGC